MKPPSNVKTPAQYVASLPADRAKTIATVRAFVNKHIPQGYEECLVWGTIGWTIPLSRYPDTYNKQPICYVCIELSHVVKDPCSRLPTEDRAIYTRALNRCLWIADQRTVV